ncbi:hypothetical protein [Pantoea dispersa]|uniref:Uncharacterized protein n=1 Tax=Pantoea dispersa TaxID=59814 RepID=A0ABY2ZZZ4_9GAMM|nr:hypothetical protein [Pantoea dispersa]TQC75550.1 hypothetical protein FK492_06395 [Pantoea dispersa]
MSQKYNGLGNSISSGLKKTNKVFLKCSNPVSQQIFDDGEFFPLDWIDPSIVAADGSPLAYYSAFDDSWHSTKIKQSWINSQAVPSPLLLEIRGDFKMFLLCIGG